MYSFEQDKKRVEIQGQMRRIADLTSPNLPPLFGTARAADRSNRTLPVLVAPYSNGKAWAERGAFAVTKDLGDHGLSVISCQPSPELEVVIGIWPYTPHVDVENTDPIFFVGRVRQCTEIGAGYWQIGIELCEVVKCRKLAASLQPLARTLLPKRAQSEVAIPSG